MEVNSKDLTDFKVDLTIDNKKVGLNSFVKNVFYNVIMGIVKSLKNVEDPKKIELKIQF